MLYIAISNFAFFYVEKYGINNGKIYLIVLISRYLNPFFELILQWKPLAPITNLCLYLDPFVIDYKMAINDALAEILLKEGWQKELTSYPMFNMQ